jgi:colanic acid/amylovoran biosynthesis glycosyltransferase
LGDYLLAIFLNLYFMKILICTSFFEKRTNGTALFPNFALKINDLYPKHEVRIVTPDVSQSYDKVFKVEFKYPRPFHAFYTFLCNFSFYKAIKKIQKEYDFDVVVFNHASNGVWSRWFLEKKIKVTGIIHDDDSIKMMRSNHESFPRFIINLIKKKLEIKAIKDFDLTLYPSLFIQNLVLDKIKIDPKKSQCFYQTIDCQSITYKPKFVIDKKNVKILFVKFSYIRGGLLDLIEALGLLSQYHFCLTVVGPAATSKNLIETTAKPHKHLSLDIRSYCPPDEVSSLMHAHDIVCVPARAEVLGLVNAEGLAHGTPVVTTRVGGIPEVMNGGENGWLAEPGKPKSLAKALQDCIEADPSVLKAKCDAGRKFVEENFDYRKMIAQFVDICEKTAHAE